MHKLLAGFAVFAVGMLGMVATAAAAGVSLDLSADQTKFGSGTIKYALRNETGAPLHVLRWQTPVDGVFNNLFHVTRDGRRVAYVGPMYKRAEPTAKDYIVLAPGQSIRAEVDLSAYYDMGAGGQYQVSSNRSARDVILEAAKAASAGAAGVALEFDRNPTEALWVDGNGSSVDSIDEQSDALSSPVTPLAATNSFVGCSNSRQNSLVTARNSAGTYANNSKNYLVAGTTGSRYTWWFGTYQSSRYSTARSHFNNIASAFSTQPMTFYCDCNDSGTYAYVYPNQPYRIHLCGAFWSASNTGTDSRAGTLVHEVSHFTVVGGTDDWAYGQSAAHSLAVSNPSRAVDNADNHEYFAENTPARN